MKFITLLSLLSFISFSTFAESRKPLKPLSSACSQFVAGKIIDFLEKEEPSAELHLLTISTNGAIEVIGLTDVNGVYPTIDFVNTLSTGRNVFSDNYQYNSVIIYADYQVTTKNGKVSCKILDIGTAQDDQDQE
jgi:hypothetical protein